MKPIFQKSLQSGHIWPRNRQKKNAQIEVFGHFIDFASLAFLDFARNDRWAWCLVVFLQFTGPVNVFLFKMQITVQEAFSITVSFFQLNLISIIIEQNVNHCGYHKPLVTYQICSFEHGVLILDLLKYKKTASRIKKEVPDKFFFYLFDSYLFHGHY